METPFVYEEVLGPAFANLAPPLKRLHGPQQRRFTGVLTVRTGTHLLARLSLWLARLPKAQVDAPCHLCVVPSQRGERWQREIGPWTFNTRQRAANGEIRERFGIITLGLRLGVKGQRLCVRSVRTWVLGIRLPRWLNIRVVAREKPVENDSFHCNVRVYVPGVGMLLRYSGTLSGPRGEADCVTCFGQRRKAVSMKSSLILRAAGIYNVAYSLLLAFCPGQTFHRLGMPETPDIMIQGLGMIVGVYGLAYWIAGSDPVKYWPLAAVGLVGKTLGPIGFALGLLKGVFLWKSVPMFVLNDLIWWWPFWAIVLRAWRNEPHALRRVLL